VSGHSHFATIRRRKEASDAVRGKMFTKFGKEITVAVKLGGPRIESNARLRLAVQKAKSGGMPNDNINRAIKNAESGADKANYESVVYEGYGPSGIAIMVFALTDNKNRTASNVRHTFEKFGGSLGVSGSVSYIFVEIDGEYLADFSVTVPEDKIATFEKMLDTFDNDDDVQEVVHNAE